VGRYSLLSWGHTSNHSWSCRLIRITLEEGRLRDCAHSRSLKGKVAYPSHTVFCRTAAHPPYASLRDPYLEMCSSPARHEAVQCVFALQLRLHLCIADYIRAQTEGFDSMLVRGDAYFSSLEGTCADRRLTEFAWRLSRKQVKYQQTNLGPPPPPKWPSRHNTLCLTLFGSNSSFV
jgi:hypothetical protein